MKTLINVLCFLCLAVLMALGTPARAQAPAKPDIIEVIEISGEIDRSTAAMVAGAVEKINETPKIKGVLLVVNSPGGGASASAVLYQELSKIKVPVVGYCEYLCASGGAYALMATSVKYIGVRDEAIGGSIGVIMQLTRYNRLLEWAKVDSETFKSGPLKDAGSPVRAGNEADRVYLQGIVDTLAVKFYGVVSKARPKANMKALQTASIFIGDEIVRVGLADAVMSRDDAVKKVKELSGSKNAFTRDELRKVTKDASEAAGLRGGSSNGPRATGWEHDLSTAMDLLQEIRGGESIKFAYRMPYEF